MKVLVVEDPVKLQTSPSTGLESLGYAVDVVADDTEAISYASNRDYDIIILDLILPKESSLLILHEIRELDREVEILILSARDQIHDRVTALIQGADDYLVKPFSLDDLHASIQSLVKRKPGLRDDNDSITDDASTHLNRLIENLLQLCHCQNGEIELVISEIKLSRLFDKAFSNLVQDAKQKNIALPLPTEKLPTLLVDAKWLEHLLAILMANAINRSPAGSEIRIGVQTNAEYCALEIENKMSEALSRAELNSMFNNFRNRDVTDKSEQPIARLSLAKSYADCMNFNLKASLVDEDRFRVRISNIKII